METTENIAINSIVIESDEVEMTDDFVGRAFGLNHLVGVRSSHAPTDGFRGFSISLVFEQPADVDMAAAAAVEAGAQLLKPVAKSFWGYGGSLRAPDGTVWTLASSSKKNTAEPTGRASQIVLLVGVDDVRETKDFYRERGVSISRGFGSKYVEFDTGPAITLAIQSQRAVAKNAGVDPEGSGSHRLMIVGTLGEFVDPDGFTWR